MGRVPSHPKSRQESPQMPRGEAGSEDSHICRSRCALIAMQQLRLRGALCLLCGLHQLRT
jgi:hypothetical protein